jgi:hypothetical protein
MGGARASQLTNCAKPSRHRAVGRTTLHILEGANVVVHCTGSAGVDPLSADWLAYLIAASFGCKAWRA